MGSETFELTGGEVAEVTAQLRWVPMHSMGSFTADFELRKKLQQAWRISVRDNDGRTWGTRIEWRDVPTELNPQ